MTLKRSLSKTDVPILIKFESNGKINDKNGGKMTHENITVQESLEIQF